MENTFSNLFSCGTLVSWTIYYPFLVPETWIFIAGMCETTKESIYLNLCHPVLLLLFVTASSASSSISRWILYGIHGSERKNDIKQTDIFTLKRGNVKPYLIGFALLFPISSHWQFNGCFLCIHICEWYILFSPK